MRRTERRNWSRTGDGPGGGVMGGGRRQGESDEISRPGDDGTGGSGWRRETDQRSRQLAQTNREWRDTYFVAHVF